MIGKHFRLPTDYLSPFSTGYWPGGTMCRTRLQHPFPGESVGSLLYFLAVKIHIFSRTVRRKTNIQEQFSAFFCRLYFFRLNGKQNGTFMPARLSAAATLPPGVHATSPAYVPTRLPHSPSGSRQNPGYRNKKTVSTFGKTKVLTEFSKVPRVFSKILTVFSKGPAEYQNVQMPPFLENPHVCQCRRYSPKRAVQERRTEKGIPPQATSTFTMRPMLPVPPFSSGEYALRAPRIFRSARNV